MEAVKKKITGYTFSTPEDTYGLFLDGEGVSFGSDITGEGLLFLPEELPKVPQMLREMADIIEGWVKEEQE